MWKQEPFNLTEEGYYKNILLDLIKKEICFVAKCSVTKQIPTDNLSDV